MEKNGLHQEIRRGTIGGKRREKKRKKQRGSPSITSVTLIRGKKKTKKDGIVEKLC